jgi:hypothetical protein
MVLCPTHNHQLPAWVRIFTHSVYNPEGDGNCGYACVAHALAAERPESPYAKANGWYQVRLDMLVEMESNRLHWTRKLGGPAEFDKAYQRIHMDGPKFAAPHSKWMSRLDAGPILANTYNRPFVFVTNDQAAGCMTFIPATIPPGAKPLGPIFLALINNNHWIHLIMKRTLVPFPPPHIPRLFHKYPSAGWLSCIEPSTSLYHSLVLSQCQVER